MGERLQTAPITARFGVRVAHEVTDEAFAAGRGEYEAVAGSCSFLRRWSLRPAGRVRRAWACWRRRAEPLPHHADRATVVAGCCGHWCP